MWGNIERRLNPLPVIRNEEEHISVTFLLLVHQVTDGVSMVWRQYPVKTEFALGSKKV